MTPENIKQIRHDLKISRSELGESIGVSQRTIENWEQGRRPIPRWAEKFLPLAINQLKKP